MVVQSQFQVYYTFPPFTFKNSNATNVGMYSGDSVMDIQKLPQTEPCVYDF